MYKQERNNELFADYKAGMSDKALAEKYSLSLSGVRHVVAYEQRDEMFREKYPELASLSRDDRHALIKMGVHNVEFARKLLDRLASGEKIFGVGEKGRKLLEAYTGESMRLTYLANAFSLQMLDLRRKTTVKISPVDAAEVAAVPDLISVVGHADTAAVLSDMLGKEVAFNRVSLRLVPGDILYVAQVVGGRLPEGSTTLPEGFQINFVRVDLK